MTQRLTIAELPDFEPNPSGRILFNLREAVAIQDAIEFGELLSAIPVDMEDRRRHAAATTLLERQAILLRRCLAVCEQWAASQED